MKRSILKQLSLVSVSAVLVCSVMGCADRMYSRTSYESGPSWAKGSTVEVDRLPDGNIMVEKDAFWERYVCIRHGKHIKATGRHDCERKGGRTYFEVINKDSVRER